jgi:molybdopterin/thiamine biosynthesis adenylyltransferase
MTVNPMDQVEGTELNLNYRPIIFAFSQKAQKAACMDLIQRQNPHVIDRYESQLLELVKVQHPTLRMDPVALNEKLMAKIHEQPLEESGIWVYYSWNNSLVHVLDEEDFFQVRTNRNQYKIEPHEQEQLRQACIGIVGLSVGQCIALTLAMERTCGTIRLADFDEIELSNMNRIRCSVADMGINKAIVAARQIAELDPFIQVECFTDGLTRENMSAFFNGNGKPLDVLVEECDGIDMKIISRIHAKALQIPVVMDTNDKGMLDIERFDLEPNRPILHGKVPDLEDLPLDSLYNRLKTLTLEEKVGYLTKIIGYENISPAMLRSLPEMNKSIIGWPQLASAVALGGAMVTDTCRKIITRKKLDSGRIFIDFDQIIQ